MTVNTEHFHTTVQANSNTANIYKICRKITSPLNDEWFLLTVFHYINIYFRLSSWICYTFTWCIPEIASMGLRKTAVYCSYEYQGHVRVNTVMFSSYVWHRATDSIHRERKTFLIVYTQCSCYKNFLKGNTYTWYFLSRKTTSVTAVCLSLSSLF